MLIFCSFSLFEEPSYCAVYKECVCVCVRVWCGAYVIKVLFSTAQLTAIEKASVFHSDTKSGSGKCDQRAKGQGYVSTLSI